MASLDIQPESNVVNANSASGISLSPHRGVPGVTRTSLWLSWKEIRKKLKDSSLRDAVDWIEYDLNPDKWLGRLLADVKEGRYEPHRPVRFALGKSKGFSRWMTLPEIRDLVLFHTLATSVVARAQSRRRKPRHVYFMRDKISAVQQKAEEEGRQTAKSDPKYKTGFYVWLRLHQYRRFLVFKKIYPYLVVTDISNFFDSVVYTQLEASLFEYGIPRNVVGLLSLLLERLSVRDSYSALPRIGLPVDQFDCSRCLAHLLLFAHDDRMISAVSEAGYIRWMDDQTFGVKDEAAAYSLLAQVNDSLRRMHLVPNGGKTKILTLNQARGHFHFGINDDLDALDRALAKGLTPKVRRESRRALARAWRRARAVEGNGEWGKILRRFYRVAAVLGLRFLLRRAHPDLLADPGLTDRVLGYLRTVGTVGEFLTVVDGLLADERLVYADVRRAIHEECLRLEPETAAQTKDLRRRATEALRGASAGSATSIPPDLAALMLLRFGDGRSNASLGAYLRAHEVAESRGVAFVLASGAEGGRRLIRERAEQTLNHELGVVTKFVEEVRRLSAMPDRIKARLRLRFDSVARRKYVDMRILLIARLFAVNQSCRLWILGELASWKKTVSVYDAALLSRVLRV